MRCYVMKTARLGAFLLILSYLCFSVHQWSKKPQVRPDWASVWQHQETNTLWSERKDIMPLNVSIRLLAGVLPTQKKFLTVGLSSVERRRGSYLMGTLESVFSQSSEEELAEMVVVVLLADFDLHWVDSTLESITDRFGPRLSLGQLLVIHADQEAYPPLTGLKRNFNDPPDRVKFRSKQNADYAFLLQFSSSLAWYYVMIEDDVSCSKHFFTAIHHHIKSKVNTAWATLEFSKLGYIGKLYHSKDLPLLARFLLLFYQEMPCDFLLSHFRVLLTQHKPIHFLPSLFQHKGTFSSFQGTYNRLKDDDFVEEVADNPPASVFTDIVQFGGYSPEQAYSQGKAHFWGKSPITKGSYFMVVFHSPVRLSRIVVETGSEKMQDILSSAVVEVGLRVERKECSGFHEVGVLSKGRFELTNVPATLNSTVSCLRIRVTASQSNWVIIRNIQIWTLQKRTTVATS